MSENAYWRRILESTFVDSLSEDFKERVYYFLKCFANEINGLNRAGYPRAIDGGRFKEICDRTRPFARYVDHTTLNVEKGRLENVVETALMQGFFPTYYFLPVDEKTGMICIVVENNSEELYIAINEGLDGWTPASSERIKEFQKYLVRLFYRTGVPIPGVVEGEQGGKKTLTVLAEGDSNPPIIEISEDRAAKSHISDSVEKHGEFLQHYALDATYFFTSENFFDRRKARPGMKTMDHLFQTVKDRDILPLASEHVLEGSAGRTPEDRHVVKQFFGAELAHGWFPEFIERMGPNAKRGLFVANTVLGLYRDKEKEMKK